MMPDMTADGPTDDHMARLVGLDLADDPIAWAAAGFRVRDDRVDLGGITLRLTGAVTDAEGRRGIRAWHLTPPPGPALDGLAVVDPDDVAEPAAPAVEGHPNGATVVDHVVVGTPDLDRTTAAFATAGWAPSRTVDQPEQQRRLRFFVVPTATGKVVVEVIAPPAPADVTRPARFWGLAVTSTDLARARRVIGGHGLGEAKDAVQPGRRIATVRSEVLGIGVALALMSPRMGDT